MADKDTKATADEVGADQVQAQVDEAAERGYFGTVPDPTPNHAYTAAGNDEPTPETDEKLREKARAALRG